MSATAENDTSPEQNRPESPSDESPGEEEPVLIGGERPLTPEEWNLLRAPFSGRAYVVDSRAVGRTPAGLGGETDKAQAVVDLRLRPEAIRDRLDWVVGPDRYSYRFDAGPQGGGERSVFCHLRIGTAARTGTGTSSSLRRARRAALASAAAAFGIGASGRVAGPITAEIEKRNHVPDSVLDSLERQEETQFWAPGGEPPEGAESALSAF